MTVLQQKEVKIRKTHRCWGCTFLFPIGTTLTYVVSVDNGDFSSCYWCNKCLEIMRSEEIYEDIEYGQFNRKEKTMKRKFFKKGQYKPAVIDSNDPEVKRLLKHTKEIQEKNNKLKNVDDEILNLRITI